MTPRRFRDLPALKWAVLGCALFWMVLITGAAHALRPHGHA
jgi:hypothetical protein